MSTTFREWLNEGEAIYADAMQEYQVLETQIRELETRLVEKRTEVNQIAQMIGKPSVNTPERLAAEIIDRDTPAPNIPYGTVTRALTGRMVAR